MPEAFPETLRQVEYTNNVTHALRQEPGILYPLISRGGNHKGASEVKVEDRFGQLRMERKTTRNGDTNYQDPEVDRRFLKKPGRHNLGVMIDRDDIASTPVDMKSPIVMESAMAGRLYHDDQVLVGFWGDAWVGKETAESTVPFAAANKIALATGGAGSGLNLAKLIELKRQLRKANVNFKAEQPIILLDADAEANLFGIEEYVNFDYAGSKPLVDGELKPWMGFRFLPANLGDQNAYPQSASLFQVGGVNRLPVIVPSGLYRGVWEEFYGRIEELPTKQYSEGIYAEAESAVTRTDEAKAWFIETQPIA